jgi:hypothetical protein
VLPVVTTNTQNRAYKPPKTVNLHSSDEEENKHPTNGNRPANTTTTPQPKKLPNENEKRRTEGSKHESRKTPRRKEGDRWCGGENSSHHHGETYILVVNFRFRVRTGLR